MFEWFMWITKVANEYSTVCHSLIFTVQTHEYYQSSHQTLGKKANEHVFQNVKLLLQGVLGFMWRHLFSTCPSLSSCKFMRKKRLLFMNCQYSFQEFTLKTKQTLWKVCTLKPNENQQIWKITQVACQSFCRTNYTPVLSLSQFGFSPNVREGCCLANPNS